MVTCAVYQILTLVFKVAILSIVVACYLGVSIYQAINESNVEPGRWLAGVLVIFFMACLVAHSQHTEATYRFEHTLLPQPREYVGKFATRPLVANLPRARRIPAESQGFRSISRSPIKNKIISRSIRRDFSDNKCKSRTTDFSVRMFRRRVVKRVLSRVVTLVNSVNPRIGHNSPRDRDIRLIDGECRVPRKVSRQWNRKFYRNHDASRDAAF